MERQQEMKKYTQNETGNDRKIKGKWKEYIEEREMEKWIFG